MGYGFAAISLFIAAGGGIGGGGILVPLYILLLGAHPPSAMHNASLFLGRHRYCIHLYQLQEQRADLKQSC